MWPKVLAHVKKSKSILCVTSDSLLYLDISRSFKCPKCSDRQQPMQSIPITTNIVSSNPAQVYSIQHYVSSEHKLCQI